MSHISRGLTSPVSGPLMVKPLKLGNCFGQPIGDCGLCILSPARRRAGSIDSPAATRVPGRSISENEPRGEL
jgi:hypothetical protein